MLTENSSKTLNHGFVFYSCDLGGPTQQRLKIADVKLTTFPEFPLKKKSGGDINVKRVARECVLPSKMMLKLATQRNAVVRSVAKEIVLLCQFHVVKTSI